MFAHLLNLGLVIPTLGARVYYLYNLRDIHIERVGLETGMVQEMVFDKFVTCHTLRYVNHELKKKNLWVVLDQSVWFDISRSLCAPPHSGVLRADN